MATKRKIDNKNQKSKFRSYKKTSKMRKYQKIYDEGLNQNVTGFMKYKNIESDDDTDRAWVVEAGYEHRMDLISAKFYGTSKYDWVLEHINDIRDPIKDVSVGRKLIVPDKTRIISYM